MKKCNYAIVTNSRASFSQCRMRVHQLDRTSFYVVDFRVLTNLLELVALHESGAHPTLCLQSIHLLRPDLSLESLSTRRHALLRIATIAHASASMMPPIFYASSPQLVCPCRFQEGEDSTHCCEKGIRGPEFPCVLYLQPCPVLPSLPICDVECHLQCSVCPRGCTRYHCNKLY